MRTIKEIAQDITAQDNRLTALPMFIVERQRLIYGLNSGWADQFTWLSDGDEVSSRKRRYLEKRYDEGKETKGFERVGYIERWEFVTACFTEKGCKAYLRMNGHNLGKTRIYVETGYRNEEWAEVRAFLLDHR